MPRGRRKITAAYKADTEYELFRLAELVSIWHRKRFIHRRGRAVIRRKAIETHWGNEIPIDVVTTLKSCSCKFCKAWRLVDARLREITGRLNRSLVRLGVLSARRSEILRVASTDGLHIPGDCNGQVVMPFVKEDREVIP